MKKAKLVSNRLLVRIRENDRDELFKKSIITLTGKKIQLITDIQQNDDMDRFYSQTVNIGTVMEVADDVDNYMPGDVIWFDNLVDSDEGIIVERTSLYKDVVILANHTYHTTDYLVPPHKKQVRPQFVWRRGDMDQMSRIVGIVREDRILSPKGFIIAESNDDYSNRKVVPGLIYDYGRLSIVPRKVVISNDESKYKKDTMVLVDPQVVLEFDFGPYRFDIFFESDVLFTFEE